LTAIDDRPVAIKGPVEHFDMPAPATGTTPLPTVLDTGPPKSRLYVLDLLRFCAAALVLTFHLIPIATYTFNVAADQYFTHPVNQFFKYGWMGVELFFLISGFVICMSSWGRSLSQFFTSRVTRLMPAYLLAVLVTAALQTVFPTPGATRPTIAQVLANLTMAQGLVGVPNLDTVYWTLLVELKFYLIFAAVVWAGLTYRRTVLFCVAWMTAALFAQSADVKFMTAVLEPQYAPYFVSGMILYLIHRFGPNLLLWSMLGASWIFCTVSLHQRVPEALNFTKALFLLTAFFAVMIATALGWLSWLRWRGLVVLGALTYPVYLLHFHVGFATIRALHGKVLDWLLLTAVVTGILVLGYLVHRWVERPAAAALRSGLRRSFDEIRHHSKRTPAAHT
jgi:peptidoglycan/LPS O-acetylase OafA/YrhL